MNNDDHTWWIRGNNSSEINVNKLLIHCIVNVLLYEHWCPHLMNKGNSSPEIYDNYIYICIYVHILYKEGKRSQFVHKINFLTKFPPCLTNPRIDTGNIAYLFIFSKIHNELLATYLLWYQKSLSHQK